MSALLSRFGGSGLSMRGLIPCILSLCKGMGTACVWFLGNNKKNIYIYILLIMATLV